MSEQRLSQKEFLERQSQSKIDRKIMRQVKHRIYQSGNFSVMQKEKGKNENKPKAEAE